MSGQGKLRVRDNVRNQDLDRPVRRLGVALDAFGALVRAGAVTLTLAASIAPSESVAQAVGQEAVPVKDRHIDASRAGATQQPRSEGDQAIVDGWPLYRTERGQAAFNDAMATLKATDGAAPAAAAFKGCGESLECNLSLPALTRMAGFRREGSGCRRRSTCCSCTARGCATDKATAAAPARNMRYFVYHEFHNSTRNTDPFDTISSHSGSVFVSFYMSKQWTDAKGRRFVIVEQVAPHDVVSFHATDKGSAGPGMEVAKNYTDPLEPLQGLAGILVATIVKTAAPQLEVVNHGGTEGLPMLTQYQHRLQVLQARPNAPSSCFAVCARSGTARGGGNRQPPGPDPASRGIGSHSGRHARHRAAKRRDCRVRVGTHAIGFTDARS